MAAEAIVAGVHEELRKAEEVPGASLDLTTPAAPTLAGVGAAPQQPEEEFGGAAAAREGAANGLANGSAAPGAVHSPQQQSNGRLSSRNPVLLLTRPVPTNKLVLLARAAVWDVKRNNRHEDGLARTIRDRVFPFWVRWLFLIPGFTWICKILMEHKRFGIPAFINYIDARTKWFDRGVKEALNGGIKQVVIVAAGYDSRALRFGKPGVVFYEVDLPHVSAEKKKLLQDLSSVNKYILPVTLGADLSKVPLSKVLSESSFDISEPALFACEGLLPYLPEQAVLDLFQSIAEVAAPRSQVWFDSLPRKVFEDWEHSKEFQAISKAVESKGEPFLSGMGEPDEVEKLVKPLGFKVIEHQSFDDIMEREMNSPSSKELPSVISTLIFTAIERM